jgi:hypothetical protein
MGLHHIVAIYLYVCCYFFNIIEIGGIIALIHDISDIPVSAVKALAETRFSSATAVTFVSHMTIWFYTRMLILPWCIYLVWTAPVDFGTWYVMPTFCYLLGCMFILHCYWFWLFTKMLNKYMKSGSTEDTQSKL